MQPKDVKLYGRDYSAREYTDDELRDYMRRNPSESPVSFLGRYIGDSKNPKCISHYPGMYEHHWAADRPVFLFDQIGYSDMEGGFDRGRALAQRAVADAKSVGWDGESHIVACMDRFYAKAGYRTLNAGELSENMRGRRSVLGDRLGFYGFYDSMRDAINGDWASFYVQCGARSAHVPGIHVWQENNYQPKIFGTPTDILEMYCDPSYAFGGMMSGQQVWEEPIGDKDENGKVPPASAWLVKARHAAVATEGKVDEMKNDLQIILSSLGTLVGEVTKVSERVSKIETGGFSRDEVKKIAVEGVNEKLDN